MYGTTFEPETLAEIVEEQETQHKRREQKEKDKRANSKLGSMSLRTQTALMFSEHIETD